MSCPNCEHTMQSLGHTSEHNDHLFWCPRCGTISTYLREGMPNVSTPNLVIRCRLFAPKLGNGLMAEWWRSAGIEESIHPEANRAT